MEKQYKKPPVIEALCEFRFKATKPWDLAIPGLLYENLRKDFPERRQRKAIEVTIATSAESIQQEVSQVDRLQFWNVDETVTVQVSPHLLVINHLKPYLGWDKFKPMILGALDAYNGIASPAGLKRIGLRYINRIEILWPDDKQILLEDFFGLYPHTQEYAHKTIAEFRLLTRTEFQEGRDHLILQLNTQKTQKNVTFLLDLDYSTATEEAAPLERVEQWLQEAHEQVENSFEGCITDRLRQQFEKVGVE